MRCEVKCLIRWRGGLMAQSGCDHWPFRMLTKVFFTLLLLGGALALHGQTARVVRAMAGQTTLKPLIERVFSRKKRFLLFPKGSNLKFTCSLAKHLLSRVPRGAGFTLEAAFYYPVPGHRDDLYPKRLLGPKTTTPKPPTGTTEPTLLYIPGTDWRFKAKPVAKPNPIRLHQRIDDRPIVWSDAAPALYNKPEHWAQWNKYGDKFASWTPVKQYEAYAKPWQPATHAKWTKWTTPSPKWPTYGQQWRNPQQRWYREVKGADQPLTGKSKEEAEEEEEEGENEPILREPWSMLVDNADLENGQADEYPEPHLQPFKAPDYPDMDHLLDWRHYHGHRDRRQLFDYIGGFGQLLGMDMKYCILRAMCESKRLLLPPGYSMLQDIMRVILTMPTINGLEDEYSRLMRQDHDVCAAQLRGKCNVSLLAWLLGAKWHSHVGQDHAK